MKKILISYLFVVCFLNANSQLEKGNWLLGGNGSFYSGKNTFTNSSFSIEQNALRISISPNIGYFFADKIAIGLRTSYIKNKAESTSTSNINTNVNRLDFGPFARYFFLENDKQYNLVADIGYQYGLYWFTPTKGNRQTFSASAGTVIFLNSSVGLEFLVGYYTQKESINDGTSTVNKQKGLQMTLGFQFYLEKQ